MRGGDACRRVLDGEDIRRQVAEDGAGFQIGLGVRLAVGDILARDDAAKSICEIVGSEVFGDPAGAR